MDIWLKIEKLLLFCILVVFLGWVAREQGREVEFSKLAEEVTNPLEPERLQQGDEQLLRRLYGLNGSELKHWMLYTSVDNMDVEELLLVECRTQEQLEQVEEAVEDRIDLQKHNFEGYGPEQVQLIEQSVIGERSLYLLFVISEEAEEVREGFLRAF